MLRLFKVGSYNQGLLVGLRAGFSNKKSHEQEAYFNHRLEALLKSRS